MRRRRLTVFALGALAPLAMFAACTFPDVGFGPPGSSEAGSSDTTSGDGPNPGTDGGVDAPVEDAPTRTDAQQIVDEASCNVATNCDCDHDGYRSDKFDGGACDAFPAEAGIDCDDLDPVRHPDQDFQKLAPPSGQQPAGDWNCDGKVDKQYAEDLACGLNCSGVGFKGNVNCGESAAYYECSGVGLCATNIIEKRVQGCR